MSALLVGDATVVGAILVVVVVRVVGMADGAKADAESAARASVSRRIMMIWNGLLSAFCVVTRETCVWYGTMNQCFSFL